MKHITINNFSTALTSDITDSDTTITLDDVSRVPSAVSADTPMLMTLAPAGVALPTLSDVEIVEVTGVDTVNSTVTVNRGQDGTTAKAFTSGDTVGARVTARHIETSVNTATLAEQQAANANVNPRGTWITRRAESGAGPEYYDAFCVGPYARATSGGGAHIAPNPSIGPNYGATSYGAVAFGAGLSKGFFSFASGFKSVAYGLYSWSQGKGTYVVGSHSQIGGYYSSITSDYASGIGKDAQGAYNERALAMRVTGSARTNDANATRADEGVQIGPGSPSGVAFHGVAFAQEDGGSDFASWTFNGLARFDSGGYSGLVGSSATQTQYEGTGNNWALGFTLYNNKVYAEATGESGKYVTWSFNINAANLQKQVNGPYV